MGKFLGLHEKTYIGATSEAASGTSSARTELIANPSKNGPGRFLVMGSEPFHLRQGDSNIVASSSDMLVMRFQPVVIVVSSERNNNAAVIVANWPSFPGVAGNSGTSGTVKFTRLDDETP